jgi:hypothetical protein
LKLLYAVNATLFQAERSLLAMLAVMNLAVCRPNPMNCRKDKVSTLLKCPIV